MFSILDGETKVPNLHDGDIGNQLEGCENLEISCFEPLPIDHIFKERLSLVTDISSDQRYLRDIILAIDMGYVSDQMKRRSPGKLGYAIWLTTANRILRLYVSTELPTVNFKRIVQFTLHVYAACWFGIRAKPLFTNAPIHLFNIITAVKKLSDKQLEDETLKIIRRNAYCLYPENLLASMLVDSRPNIRFTAVKRILEARKEHEDIIRDRNMSLFTYDFNADDYYQLTKYNPV